MPGTRVVLADGTTKDIEDLRVGDKVSADDVESGDTQSRAVTDVRSHAGIKKLVTLTVDTDGGAGDGTATVTSTAAHLYWLPDVGQWVTADKLRPGMWLQTGAGTWVQVTAVKQQTRHQRVYNLTVDGLHTFFVQAGDATLLTHNTTCPTGLQPGHNVPARFGQGVHHDPTITDAFAAIGYRRGPEFGPDQPDFRTAGNFPVELKPFTPRACARGPDSCGGT